MELMELFADIIADVTTDVTTNITANVIGRTELKIWQLKELKAFNSLRLFIEDAAKAAEAAAEILAEVLIKLASETELARTEPV